MGSFKQFGVFLDRYYWRTAVLLAKSSLIRQYRNSFLGILWTLLQPLTMIVVYAVVMPIIMRYPVQNYVLYILCTMPLWGFISSVLVGSSNSLVMQGETLKRCLISSTVFPVADVLRQLYVYVIAFVTMYTCALLLGFPGSWHALLLPLYLAPVVVTLMALAVGIAFLAPYIRDVGEVLTVAMNIMFWFSAVPYPVAIAPEELRPLFEWNPFYLLLQPTVMLVYEHTIPGPAVTLRLFGLMALAITIGYALYRRCRRNFIYYL